MHDFNDASLILALNAPPGGMLNSAKETKRKCLLNNCNCYTYDVTTK